MNFNKLGGLSMVLAVVLCMAASSDDVKVNKAYAMLNPPAVDDLAARIAAKDNEAREKELQILKVYEKADFDFMARGIVHESEGN